MGPAEAVFIGVIVVGSLVRMYLTPYYRIRRQLQAAQSWPIARLPENTIGRVIGRVRLLETSLTAPLSGRACAYYMIVVTRDREDSREIVEEQRGVPFAIEDETGRAIVDPTDADVTLAFDHESNTFEATYATPEQDAVLKRHGIRSKGFMGAKPMLFRESIIGPDELVTVLGSGTREPDRERAAEADYRTAPPTLLRLTSSRAHPLAISDHADLTKPSPGGDATAEP